MRRRAPSDGPLQKPGAERVEVQLSRVMRGQPTPAEASLWSALRSRPLGGWKFRRQHVIMGYVVDFYCAELRLVVEVDGLVHERLRPGDEAREADSRRAGAEVVRFSNDAVLYRQHDVLTVLAHRCADREALLPPVCGGKAGMGGREAP